MGKIRRVRKSFVPEERGVRVVKSLTMETATEQDEIEQSIDSGSLANGGKKNPFVMPGGSGLLDDNDKEPKGMQIVQDRESELEKIKDIKAYDPHSLKDDVLRDDFRIVLAWYSSWRSDPDNFIYSESVLRRLLAMILTEAKQRGPSVITFHPATMDRDVAGFFNSVARDVGIPSEQIEKKFSLAPDSDPEEMTTDELRQSHWSLHLMYRKASKDKSIPGFSIEDVVNLHSRIVDELFKQHIKHPAPPDDGLDDSSSTFEQNAELQPDWTKLEKRYQQVVHSGNVKGEKVLLEDVLKNFETFKLRKPYIYLVGGLANHGWTEGDIDILVKDSPDLPEDFKQAIEFRLGRAMPGELASRMQVHYDDFHGPFTNHVELFDLTFERVNPKNEVKQMSDQTAEPDEDDDPEDVMLDEREKCYKEAAEKNWEPDDE